MAESLDDGEFWLPPQFLSEDEDEKSGGVNLKSGGGFGWEAVADKKGFSFEDFGFSGGSSDLSSPVESVVGSTETESDEEDFMAGLTLQMARSTVGADNTKGRSLSGSPQSTLCSVGSGCISRLESSRGSPNGPGQVSAPPATWDLLYAAAGEVARMRMNSDAGKDFGIDHCNVTFMAPPRTQSPVGVPAKNPNPDAGYYHQQIQAAQFQMLKQQQLMRLHQQQRSGGWTGPVKGTGHFQPVVQNRPRNSEFVGGTGGGCRSARPLGLSPSAWPSLQQAQPQQQSLPGVRAPFPGAPGGVKRECAGTGVFLPRRKVGACESRKKTVCSAVLPARVVQALNLNLNEMGSQIQPQPCFNGSYTSENDAPVRIRSGNQQRRSNIPAINQEILLPQEWTY